MAVEADTVLPDFDFSASLFCPLEESIATQLNTIARAMASHVLQDFMIVSSRLFVSGSLTGTLGTLFGIFLLLDLIPVRRLDSQKMVNEKVKAFSFAVLTAR